MAEELTVPSRSEPSPEGLSVEEQGRMAADNLNFPKFIPNVFVGKIQPNHWCRGWNSKRDKYCQHQAGYNTPHKGVGRCHIHGGMTPVKNGMYSTVTQGRLAQHLQKVTEMEAAVRLDLGPELNMMRAVTLDFIERYQELVDALISWNQLEYEDAAAGRRKAKPQRIPALHEVSDMLVKIASIVEKAHRQLHRDSIPKNEFFRLQQAMGEATKKKVMSYFQTKGWPEGEAESLTTLITEAWLEIEL